MALPTTKDPASWPMWLEAARSRGLLSKLPDSVISELLEGARRVEYPKGAVILLWEDTSTTLIVLRGALRTFLADKEGRQVTTRYLRPGDAVGLAAETRVPASRGLQVIEQAELLELSQGRVAQLCASDARLASAVIEEQAAKISAVLTAFYLRAFGSVRQRVVSAIVDRAALTDNLSPGQTVAGTQQELAMAVGSVREVIAAVLQDLKREGLIDIRRGGVVILEPEKLAREAAA